MKKLLYLCSIILIVSCNNDESSIVTPTNNNGITNLYATGTVSEQTPEEAKEIIFGKWSLFNRSRLAAADCIFNSIEFTEDSYIVELTVNGELEVAFGTYELNIDTNGNVSSVDLNYVLDNTLLTIATLTDIVVTESDTEIFATFLIEWNFPEGFDGCDNLTGEYSVEKDEPMDQSGTTDPNSNHAQVVGNWTFESMFVNSQDNSSEWLNEPCYEYSSDDDSDVLIDGCTPANSINLTISTYGTYALVWTGSNQGTHIETDVWNWTDETQTAFTVGSEEHNTLITIESLSDTQGVFSMTETPDPDNAPFEVYYTVYTFTKN